MSKKYGIGFVVFMTLLFLSGLAVVAWIGSNFTVQLLYPSEACSIYAPITFRGIFYDTSNDVVRYWIQYWEDSDGDGTADAGDSGSSWLTVQVVEGVTRTTEKIISSIDAGTKAMFLDSTKYMCRLYGLNSAGEVSADPSVNYMSGSGDGNTWTAGMVNAVEIWAGEKPPR